MSTELKIQLGKDEAAVIERVVPGRLVYVRTTGEAPTDTYGFKLDQVVIRKADGSCRPYRGEPLADLGIESGRIVVVWGIRNRNVQPTLVIDADRPRQWDASATFRGGSTLSALSLIVRNKMPHLR
jgi:hypothetical protein